MIESKDLRNSKIFRDLTNEEIERISPLVFEKDYRQGKALFFEGMAGGIMYLVKSGKVDILAKKGGKEIPVASLLPGDSLGEMSLIDDLPRSATAMVSQDAVLIVITKKSFQDILRVCPEGANKMLIAFLKIMSARLRNTNRIMAET